MDRLDEIEKQLDLRLISQIDAIKQWHKIEDEDMAREKLQEIESMEGLNGVQEAEVFQIGSQSDI